ncbi:MAG: hypothetical protein BEN19_03805 [Epulopiscium sp. Nuni2H_MBin003]|nr:MAG: hypothetical protein BEN19_03805 [Epulopiscium sp. Nuni2H_MBin003]
MRVNRITDLSVFEGKKIIIFGAGRLGKEAKRAFEMFKINVISFCIDAEYKSEQIGEVEGIPVITTDELVEVIDNEPQALIYLSFDSERERLEKLVGDKTDIISSAYSSSLTYHFLELTDWAVFKGKKIIIFGAGRRGKEAKKYLETIGFNVSAFCVDVEYKSEQAGGVEGIPVITTDELLEVVNNDPQIIVFVSIANLIIKDKLIDLFKEKKDVMYEVAINDLMYKAYEIIGFPIFKGKKVILFFTNYNKNLGDMERFLDYLEFVEIDVIAFCADKQNNIVKEIKDIPIITVDELIEISKYEVQLLIMIPAFAKHFQGKLENLLGDKKEIVCQIPLELLKSKIYFSWLFSTIISKTTLPKIIEYDQDLVLYSLKDLYECNIKNTIFICLPPKTGDYTLNETFIKYKINTFNLWHRIERLANLNVKADKNIKLICAVREPIAQHLSEVQQLVSISLESLGLKVMYELNSSEINKDKVLYDLKNLYVNNLSESQLIFDKYVNSYIYTNCDFYNKDMDVPPFFRESAIQDWIEYFNEQIFNLFDYPFNKEAGYSIIKHENLEVFIYQLEKLNDIVPQLSEWVGVEFDELVLTNVGEARWNGGEYKKFKKEVKLTQEYFDKCYSDPYVRHFYSEEDIEKFKKRWEPHLIKESNEVVES